MTAPEAILFEGPAGALEGVLTAAPSAASRAPRALAVVSHPHPLYGGDMDNLVVREAEAALLAAGVAVLRYNFRGTGRSDGQHDGGVGERSDLEAALGEMTRRHGHDLPILLVGYSFGAIVTLTFLADAELPPAGLAGVLVLAPPVSYFTGPNWSTAGAPGAIIYGSDDDLTPDPRVREVAVNIGSGIVRERIAGVGHDLGTFSDPAALRDALRRRVAAIVDAI
ncbi:MAG: alpha/beta fold hydrolase [Acidobacteriota bacterium]|nr:alpha/beta fold hydrolase [Acidobacteriota bacterium]